VGKGCKIIQHFGIGHHTKINHFFCTAIAKAALFGWGHRLPVFLAGFGDGELQFLHNNLFSYTDAILKMIT
jgi:hypothetical protein